MVATTDTGPMRLPAMKPVEVHLMLAVGLQARDGDLILIAPDGHCLGPPWASLYWTTKESKEPWATVQERRESAVAPATVSSPAGAALENSGWRDSLSSLGL